MKRSLFILLSAICGFNCFAQLPSWLPKKGLIAWYPFHGNANDESGNNNNGTVNGAVLTTDRFGKAKDAYSFDGSGTSISVPGSASLESPTTRLTMSAWVNLAGVSLTGSQFDPILCKSNSGTNAFMYNFFVSGNPPSGLDVEINNFNTATSASYNFVLHKWYMVTAVLDSTTAYFYVNGSIVSTNTFTTNIIQDTRPLTIGADPPGFNEVFNGRIDDLGIWSRALTSKEVNQLYLSCTTPTTATISSYGNTTFCAGSDVLLTATPNSFATYQWKENGDTIAGETTSTYNANATANYRCVITNNCGTATSNTIKATKLDLATVSISASGSLNICAGSSVTLTATDPGAGYAYQWYRNDVAINGATALIYKAYSAGTYKIMITNTANGCARNSGTKKVVIINCLNAHAQEPDAFGQSNIRVYPNPVSNLFRFELNKNVSGTATVTLVNVLGQEVFKSKTEIYNGQLMKNISIDNKLQAGVYTMRVSVNERIYAGKLMIQ